MEELISFLLDTVGRLGYPGIFLLMALESSFFPFPSEVVIPPAAYLASRGEMDLYGIIGAGVAGSLAGAWFNYLLALKLGRPALEAFLRRYGKYLFLSEFTLYKVEDFFDRHGHVSTFIGRLLPGIRQYISLPAGLGRMNPWLFSVFTLLGAGLWVTVLAICGYVVGKNESMLHKFLHQVSGGMIVFSLVVVFLYVLWKKKKFSGL
ncbi:DedA family protein [Thermosulfurimonas sp. F29]|uniref:DedA family protein n=1 Tax=Thermosulfurimonas sp. F29 TaxID=2867247 RepID=UPI001C839B64|nr:DedA family protein [Thermosulfurimonas sp. F29]MBX6422527.1 DedA family protein [Thermosulfurimonas sp. F29]